MTEKQQKIDSNYNKDKDSIIGWFAHCMVVGELTPKKSSNFGSAVAHPTHPTPLPLKEAYVILFISATMLTYSILQPVKKSGGYDWFRF